MVKKLQTIFKTDKELIEKSSKSNGLDILALLVSIYGSSDLFIVEYRNLLSDKLINNTKYSTESEVSNLELLKIRYKIIYIFLLLNNI